MTDATHRTVVIVVNWNCADDTVSCLSALTSRWDTLVVDNGSEMPGETRKIRTFLPQTHLIELDLNRGYGGGMNEGMRWALGNGYSHALLLNPDTVPTRELVQRMDELSRDFKLVGVRQAHFLDARSAPIEYASAAMLTRAKPKPAPIPSNAASTEVDIVTGAAILVDLQAAKDVDFFDEDYFHYKEEFDLAYKMHETVGRAIMATDQILLHRRGGSLPINSAHAVYYHFRNEMLFLRKHFSPWEWLRMPGLFRNGIREFLGGTAGVKRAVVYGFADGLMGRKGPSQRDF